MRTKPDDRKDNAEKLQKMVQDTVENLHAAEASIELTDSDQQKQQIQAKNERRAESIDAMRDEIKDEAHK